MHSAKTTCCFIALALFASRAISSDFGVLVNGQALKCPTPIKSGATVLVPVRKVCEALGATVTSASEVITIQTAAGRTSVVRIGKSFATINGSGFPLEAVPRIVKGSAYVPASFVSAALMVPMALDTTMQVVSFSRGGSSSMATLPVVPAEVVSLGPSLQSIAVIPWTLTDCTEGGRRKALEILDLDIKHRGLTRIDEGSVRRACKDVFGTLTPEEKDGPLPTIQQMLKIGNQVNAKFVIAGNIKWRTDTIYTLKNGMTTKAYTNADVRIVDMTTGKLVLDVDDMKTDSENRSDLAAVASWLLLGIPQPFSGGPKDPHHQRAGAAVVAKALSEWK